MCPSCRAPFDGGKEAIASYCKTGILHQLEPATIDESIDPEKSCGIISDENCVLREEVYIDRDTLDNDLGSLRAVEDFDDALRRLKELPKERQAIALILLLSKFEFDMVAKKIIGTENEKILVELCVGNLVRSSVDYEPYSKLARTCNNASAQTFTYIAGDISGKIRNPFNFARAVSKSGLFAFNSAITGFVLLASVELYRRFRGYIDWKQFIFHMKNHFAGCAVGGCTGFIGGQVGASVGGLVAGPIGAAAGSVLGFFIVGYFGDSWGREWHRKIEQASNIKDLEREILGTAASKVGINLKRVKTFAEARKLFLAKLLLVMARKEVREEGGVDSGINQNPAVVELVASWQIVAGHYHGSTKGGEGDSSAFLDLCVLKRKVGEQFEIVRCWVGDMAATYQRGNTSPSGNERVDMYQILI